MVGSLARADRMVRGPWPALCHGSSRMVRMGVGAMSCEPKTFMPRKDSDLDFFLRMSVMYILTFSALRGPALWASRNDSSGAH